MGVPAALLLVLASGGDAPVRTQLLPVAGAIAKPDAAATLATARRYADELRFEEALVEYQRYLGDSERPARERAKATLEVALIHLVLGDEVNAQKRAAEALELDPMIALPPDAPKKHQEFLAGMRRKLKARPTLEVLTSTDPEHPETIRARPTDPERRIETVMLRHALAPQGPFAGAPMRCTADACVGEIPSPSEGQAFTAWYYLEALDEDGNTVAQAASASKPLQVSLISRSPWFRSPYVWGGGAALVVGAAAVFFIASGGASR